MGTRHQRYYNDARKHHAKWVRAWYEAYREGRPHSLLPVVAQAQGKLF